MMFWGLSRYSVSAKKPKIRDKRWQNFDPLPVTVLLFFLATVLIGLSSGELFLGFSIFSLTILLISCVTLIHSFLDGFLYFSGHLQPVYVLSLSVIMMVLWFIAVAFGVADITKDAAGSNYQYCVGTFKERYSKRLGCFAPRARLGVEILVLTLYIVATIMAALAHERYTAFLRSEIFAHRCTHRTIITATDSRLNTGGSVPPVSTIFEVIGPDTIAPAIPARSLSRRGTWALDENEKLPIFAETQMEGDKRVLSVRNI